MIAFESTVRPPASTISRSETAQVEQRAPLTAPRRLIRPEAAPATGAAQGGSERPRVTREGYTSERAGVAAALAPLAVFAGLLTLPTWLPALVELGVRIGEGVGL